jgi:hypothetical protein
MEDRENDEVEDCAIEDCMERATKYGLCTSHYLSKVDDNY